MFTQQSSKVRQAGNTVDGGGSIVAGNQTNDKHYHFHSPVNSELFELYEKMADGSGELCSDFCEQLNHYLSVQNETDVRGLDAKLSESNRAYLLIPAKEMKEKAYKEVMRTQTSRTAQRIFVIILDRIYTNFLMTITPLIQEGNENSVIDKETNELINSIYESLGSNLLKLTQRDLLGLLFFLGGNCHIRWDKC
ncbi:ABC-three component system protein [Providencia sp. JUb39]|uniref:ABC-three component system protein n=1 Tax=Providencia sp. JUb39 TaxID=2724165 RepID=UPI00164D3D56|nr:hypothetical protein [Providencia sp. JUb39]